MAKGYFSIIQFSPDPAHNEAINIGILLSVPELGYINTKVTDNFTRIKNVMLSTQDDDFLITAVNAFIETITRDKQRYNSKEELEHLILTRAHEIQLTNLRTIKTNDPQKDLDEIFDQLVPVKQKTTHEKTDLLFPEFDRSLHSLEFENRIEFNKELTLPLSETRFFAPYTYLNNRDNLVKPVIVSSIDIAEKLAFEGGVLDSKCNMQLIVLADIKINTKNASKKVHDIFDYSKVGCFQKEDLNELVNKIKKEAHVLPRKENLQHSG